MYVSINLGWFKIAVKQIKKQQQMLKEQPDKENQMPSMTLDFKKKPKSKPSTDRASSSSSLLKTQQVNLTPLDTIALLQKKKQYSQTIRQKNLTKEVKKIPGVVTDEKTLTERPINNSQTFKFSSPNIFDQCEFGSFKSQQDSKEQTKRIQSIYKPAQPKKETKSKGRCTKQQKAKLQQLTLMIEGIKQHNFDQNCSISSAIQNFTSHERKMSNDFSMIQKINDISRIEGRVQICPQQVDEAIGPFVTEELKEIQMLRKQNSTFKKELANFRKDNGSLKRQMEELKKQITLFQERNEYLQEQSAEQFKLLESLQTKVSQPEVYQRKESYQIPQEEAFECEGKLKQIIGNYENSLFEATNLNKKLQFRNYMLEKRLMDETETHKKLMAKEISMWKDRYVKARNENLRLKDSRSQMLFEMSISQEM